MEEANKLQMPEETSKDSPEHVEAMVKKADEHANIKDINTGFQKLKIMNHQKLMLNEKLFVVLDDGINITKLHYLEVNDDDMYLMSDVNHNRK